MACDPQAVLAAAQDLFRARLAALIKEKASNPPHSAGNLASGWWTQYVYASDGSRYYGGERHNLSTAADMEMANNKLKIRLIYSINTVG